MCVIVQTLKYTSMFRIEWNLIQRLKEWCLRCWNYLLDKEMLSYINEYGQCYWKKMFTGHWMYLNFLFAKYACIWFPKSTKTFLGQIILHYQSIISFWLNRIIFIYISLVQKNLNKCVRSISILMSWGLTYIVLCIPNVNIN